MSKITVDRAVLEQALEALEHSETTVPYVGFGMAHREADRKHGAAITALRAALAQQAEPAPGWCKHCKQYSIEEPLPAQQAEPKTNWCGETCERAKLCAVCARELAGGQAEPVDQTVMELAESVGLIGPASRAHDLHGAIQRFHDLIVMNASIKAVAAFAAPPQRKPLTEEEIERHIGYRLPAYSMRLLLELVNGRAHGIGGDDGQA